MSAYHFASFRSRKPLPARVVRRRDAIARKVAGTTPFAGTEFAL